MKQRTKFVGTIVIAATLAALPAIAASAASYSGSKICGGTTIPDLTVDAKSSGTITWVNRLNAASSSRSFPGGHSDNWSPYQQTNWTAYASGGFYYAPTAACY
jgi:hypothetical protein